MSERVMAVEEDEAICDVISFEIDDDDDDILFFDM